MFSLVEVFPSVVVATFWAFVGPSTIARTAVVVVVVVAYRACCALSLAFAVFAALALLAFVLVLVVGLAAIFVGVLAAALGGDAWSACTLPVVGALCLGHPLGLPCALGGALAFTRCCSGSVCEFT